jgi:hypothetical protein
MATYRSPAVLVSPDGTRTSGTAALFTEPGRKGGIAPWAGDFRVAADSVRIKNPVGKTLTLEMPDGRTGKVVVQSLKGGSKSTILGLLGEDLAPF